MAGTKGALVLNGAHVGDQLQGIDAGAGAVHSITLIGWRGYGGCVSFHGCRGSDFIENGKLVRTTAALRSGA